MRSETFEWTGPLIGPRVDTRMSGVAYLSGIRDGIVAPPQLGPLASAEIVEIGRGRVQLICSASDAQFGLLQELDPGMAGLLLNSAVGCVAQTLVGRRQGWAAVESRIAYLRPGSPRIGALTATAEVVDSFGPRTLVTGELADAGGQVLTRISTMLEVFDLDAATPAIDAAVSRFARRPVGAAVASGEWN